MLPTHLDPSTLQAFTSTFFGYGNLAADWWFVGMEEGGGHSADEIERRFAAWRELGQEPTIDIVEFGRRADIGEHLQWFEGGSIGVANRPMLNTGSRTAISSIPTSQKRSIS